MIPTLCGHMVLPLSVTFPYLNQNTRYRQRPILIQTPCGHIISPRLPSVAVSDPAAFLRNASGPSARGALCNFRLFRPKSLVFPTTISDFCPPRPTLRGSFSGAQNLLHIDRLSNNPQLRFQGPSKKFFYWKFEPPINLIKRVILSNRPKSIKSGSQL